MTRPSDGGRARPRGGRAHLRAGGLGPAGRLGSRGHQDRADRAGRRHAGPGLDRRDAHHAATCTRCSSTPTGASGASRSTSPRPRASTSSTSWPRPRDVFLTNKLPRVRKKLKIELDDIRAHNPNIIYVAGTGQGERGPDADKGSYDSLAFWYRAGVALGVKPADIATCMPARPARASATPSAP